ncbi:STE/STE7 protein kinase [Salpingoeca rosetta]|uniref:mitogen-activated protein kinase kinase n=1 Tax=Salpingoeca rosetta (strain ATCC 50818 / BSB-021) TaxID=946362 RepID=F2UP36_SALR5|nr:STE/STE7 protein kinase [Salpingoeca rosetta]EGD79391.1 STE/STE7 protein kinase [Salpingoeca rosetta]|eukprot:XP_004989160.1 STE/STE7 protein kinase [Salpingoeca rosetta]
MGDQHDKFKAQGITMKQGTRPKRRLKLGAVARGTKPNHLPIDDPVFELIDKERHKLGWIMMQGKQPLRCEVRKLKLNDKACIGKGQFGYVFRATVPNTTTHVAVKQVPDTSDSHRRRSLMADLQTSRLIQHPNFVKFFGFDYWEASLYIFLELMDADWERIYTTVAATHETIPEPVLRSVATAIGSALVHLETEKILHRDIKPSNMLLGFDGSIKLCDFSISRQVPEGAADSYVGCGPYMSPERMSSQRYDLSSELWSTGISLLELANLRHPLAEEQKSIERLLGAVGACDFDKRVRSGFSDQLSDLIHKCLEKECEHRIDVAGFNRHPFLRGETADASQWWREFKDRHANPDRGDGGGLAELGDALGKSTDTVVGDADDGDDGDDDDGGDGDGDGGGTSHKTFVSTQQRRQPGARQPPPSLTAPDDAATPRPPTPAHEDLTPAHSEMYTGSDLLTPTPSSSDPAS